MFEIALKFPRIEVIRVRFFGFRQNRNGFFSFEAATLLWATFDMMRFKGQTKTVELLFK